MMNVSAARRRLDAPADQLMRPALRGRLVALAVGVAVLTAASRAALPFVGTPVPFTLQPQAVLLVAALWPRPAGVLAICSWLGLGAVGLPVFAAGVGAPALVGPTAGYLLSYLPVGYAVARWGRGTGAKSALVWLLGSVGILFGGVVGLVPYVGASVAWQVGLMPFVLGDASKAAAVFLLRRQLGRA